MFVENKYLFKFEIMCDEASGVGENSHFIKWCKYWNGHNWEEKGNRQ